MRALRLTATGIDIYDGVSPPNRLRPLSPQIAVASGYGRAEPADATTAFAHNDQSTYGRLVYAARLALGLAIGGSPPRDTARFPRLGSIVPVQSDLATACVEMATR